MGEHHDFRFDESLRKTYQEKGYVILRDVIPPDWLETLRSECDACIREQDEEMEKHGTDILDLSRKNSRYFVFLAYKTRPQLGKFIFSELMAEICKGTIGETAYIFWEQFVVKGTDKKGAEFGWHQDSGYVDTPHKPYVNAWIPLDDVDGKNGTISLLSYEKAGTRDKIEHKVKEGSSDRIGYFGDDPGELAVMKAGSICVFSSHTLHRSGANSTTNMRRAYALQYAPEVIFEPDGSVKGLDELFLKDGKRVK